MNSQQLTPPPSINHLVSPQLRPELFTDFMHLFIHFNHQLNLLSLAQEPWLWEKHVVDSLALRYFMQHFNYDYRGKRLLDCGSGGGLPALPLAIFYPELAVIALDSIHKKIRAVNQMAQQLRLANLQTVCGRMENYTGQLPDLITARAVAPLSKLVPLVAAKLPSGGYLIAYKGSQARSELRAAEPMLTKWRLTLAALLPYTLPLAGDYQRCLVILRKL